LRFFFETRFFAFFPTFISSCGFGFMRTSAPIRRLVPSTSWFFAMLKTQLDRIHLLVGRIATEFSEIETLWYLIFTCLMNTTPRPVADAIFNQFKTGAQQRQMVIDVAAGALPPDSPLLISIKTLCEQTKTLAGRRNAAVHSIIYIVDAAIPPYIGAGGSSKPSKIKPGQVETEVVEIYKAIMLHGLDMHELRLQAIRHANPTMNISREEQRLARDQLRVPQSLLSDPIVQALLQQQ
jgi:hypothetical protein